MYVVVPVFESQFSGFLVSHNMGDHTRDSVLWILVIQKLFANAVER